MIGLPHSFCRAACSGEGGALRADDAEISEAFEAMEVVVLERARVAVESSTEGGGTDSMTACEFEKVSSRYDFSLACSRGTESKAVGERVWRAE